MTRSRVNRTGWLGLHWLGQYERSALWALVFGGSYAVLEPWPLIMQSLGALNMANVSYLLLTWLACHRMKAPELRAWATQPFPRLLQDHPWLDFWLMGGRTGLSFVLSASIFGFLAAVLFLPAVERFGLSRPQLFVTTLLCVLTVLCAWLMAHLAFALHYAFLDYRRAQPGLKFPDDSTPDLMDFTYFAFTVGATFATSDVNVTSKEMRRTVLKHTIFSFLFNTAILALTVQFAVK